jgi:hypothetical protein
MYHLIPTSPTTAGHGTVMDAALWKHKLVEFLDSLPPAKR